MLTPSLKLLFIGSLFLSASFAPSFAMDRDEINQIDSVLSEKIKKFLPDEPIYRFDNNNENKMLVTSRPVETKLLMRSISPWKAIQESLAPSSSPSPSPSPLPPFLRGSVHLLAAYPCSEYLIPQDGLRVCQVCLGVYSLCEFYTSAQRLYSLVEGLWPTPSLDPMDRCYQNAEREMQLL